MSAPASRPASSRLPSVAVLAVATVLVTAAILLAMGRPAICPCGSVKLWHGAARSAETSQHLSDPYTFTHVIHGFLLYLAAFAIGRLRGGAFAPAAAFLLATLVECGWEVLENSPPVIARYRAGTAALGYTGDSVINSLSDIAAMMVGFGIAARLPAVATVALAFVMEVALGYAIRDNLTLNVLMLLVPLDRVSAWQAGA